MIDYDTIIADADILDVTGFTQNTNPELQLSDTLLESDSGLSINEVHTLLNIDNIKNSAPDFSQYTYTAWVAGTYTLGTIRSNGSYNWIVTAASTSEEPTGTPTDWEVYTENDAFEEWLWIKKKQGIRKAIQDFESMKLNNKTTQSLMSKLSLYEGTQRNVEYLTVTDNIVGLEIVPIASKNMKIVPDAISLQFESNGDVDIYIFHSSRETYVTKQTITYSGSGSVQWTDLNINWTYGQIDPGGSWYVCYDTRTAPGRSINKVKDWRVTPCMCTRGDYDRYNTWSKYMYIEPFRNTGSLTSETLFDVAENSYFYTENYGINLKLSVYCDLTQFIIDNRMEFKHIINHAIGLTFLKEMAMNSNQQITRSQNNISKDVLIYEIDGDTRGRAGGVGFEYKELLKALDINLQGIDKECLTCNKKGIKFR